MESGKMDSKKAIIIIPGIMGSQIFAAETITVPPTKGFADFPNTFQKGTRLWDPAVSRLMVVDEKILALACDSDGKPVYPTCINPPTVNKYNKRGGFQYGATDIYRRLYNRLYRHYHKHGYDIVLFEFDWREDQLETAKKLLAFIEESGYESVVLVSHSMGGIVASYFLSLGEKARKYVYKHISVGAPYLGTVELPYLVTTGNIRYSAFENMVVSEPVAQIITNIPAIYVLTPFKQHWRPFVSHGAGTGFYETYEETLEALEHYIPGWNKKLAGKIIAEQSLMFNPDGSHITSLVDTRYVVGTGRSTTCSVYAAFDNPTDPTRFLPFNSVKNTEGDGMVTKHSATIGDTIPAERLFLRTNTKKTTSEHVAVVSCEDPKLSKLDYSTVDLVISLLKELAPPQQR